MKIRLAALDLDGTTLMDSKQISPANRAALERMMEEGVHVIIASGRALTSLPESVLNIPGIEYAITSNGSAVYYLPERKCLTKYFLSEEAACFLLNLAEEYDLAIEVFVGGNPYAQKEYVADPARFGISPKAVNYVHTTRTPVEDVIAFAGKHIRELESMDLIIGPEELRPVVRQRIETSGMPMYLTTSVANRLELASPDAGKASGLQFVMDLLGVSREETAAFGDADNDIDMIELAGFGIAVENGTPGCLAAADYVTKSNKEDGVAWAVERILA